MKQDNFSPENADLAAVIKPPEIPGIAKLVPDSTGLLRYEIKTAAAEAHVYLQGAHLTHFAPTGQREMLFISRESHFDKGHYIHGGAPLIFPWFGIREDCPQHGFARSCCWTPESIYQHPDDSVTLELKLESNAETRAIWGESHVWTLRYRITVSAALTLELEIENRGSAPLRCEEAFHTYFRVGDVRKTEVWGLEGEEYYDKNAAMTRKRQNNDPLRFAQTETTRFYMNTTQKCVINDPVWQRRIVIEKEHSKSTMVWTPWIERAKMMANFGDNEWPLMACVETGNVIDNALEIAPGQRHVTRTVLHCEKF